MKSFWTESYPTGIPRVINTTQYTDIASMLEDCCRRYADKPAFTCLSTHLSYHDFKEKADILASAWQGLGFKKGDRLAIMMPNSFQYVIALFAAFMLGLVVVNLDCFCEEEELLYVLEDADVKAVFGMDLFLGELLKVLPKLSIEHLFSTRLGDCVNMIKAPIVNCLNRRSQKTFARVPSDLECQHHSWRFLMRLGRRGELKRESLSANDLAFIQYTQGTTGKPKGVMLTHQNVLANSIQLSVWIEPAFKGIKEGVSLAIAPFGHIASLSVSCFSQLLLGMRLVLVVDPFDVKAVATLFCKEPVTVTFALNSVYNALLLEPNFQYANFSQLRLAMTGCVPALLSVADRWRRITGVSIVEGYSLAEAAPVVTLNPVSRHEEHFNGSAGLPLPSTMIKVIDASGLLLPDGEVGEICVRGPQLFLAYWRNEEATRAAFDSDGWYRTGDVGYRDPQGYLYVTGRKADLFKLGGLTVHPSEVEEVLVACRQVAEAVVVAVPGLKRRVHMVAVIVPRQGFTVSIDALVELCQRKLPPQKVPHSFEFWSSLPKSSAGKVYRRKIRAEIQRRRKAEISESGDNQSASQRKRNPVDAVIFS